jgi:branched-chain amino acid transport system permease protein
MQFWIIQGLNSLSLGGLLFLLSSGFSLIFGLMRLANLAHGAFFMLGAYFAATAMRSYDGLNIWVTALGAGIAVAAIGGLFERLVLSRLKTNPLGQVLVTLGMSFIISDACLMLWGGDSIPVPTPPNLQSPTRVFGFVFPTYRLVLVGCAVAAAILLYFLVERTRLGAMIRAGVDDRQMARAIGIPVSNLFTFVFCLGTGVAGAGGVLGGPILSAYPGLDSDMLPLALIVVILGGIGSLLGAFIGSFIIGIVYTFGTALFPELAYIILFLPMIFVIAFRPQGLFGRVGA